ncbi:hypothetical protein E3P91_03290 [Wallemia ichthyophaga]|nr:hypothetical protein E3P91_03290 [Wallemia ichthyophaga]TIB60271.1 hypothetical protein E3P78_03210 [Wallemia ichthyophaga]
MFKMRDNVEFASRNWGHSWLSVPAFKFGSVENADEMLYEQLCELPQDVLIRIVDFVPSLAAVNRYFYALGSPALLRCIADPNGITKEKIGLFNPLCYKRRKDQCAYLSEIANDDRRMQVKWAIRSLAISIANDIVTSDLTAAMRRLSNVKCPTITGFVNAPLEKLLSEVSMSNVTDLTLNLWTFDELDECIAKNVLQVNMPSLQHLQLHVQCIFTKTASNSLIYPQLNAVVSNLRDYLITAILPCFDTLIVRGLIFTPHLKACFPQLRGSEFYRARVFKGRENDLVEVEVYEKLTALGSAYGVTSTQKSISDMLVVC